MTTTETAGGEHVVFMLHREREPLDVVAQFTVDGEPVSKARARFTKTGHAYTPAKTRSHEAKVGWAFRAATALGYKPDRTTTFGVMAVFFADTRQRRDVDNMLKAILDGLNGVAWDDDSQVTEVAGRRGHDQPGNARTEVMIYRTGELPDKRVTCKRCGTKYHTFKSWPNRSYCSKPCYLAGVAEARQRTCRHCGQTFEATGSRSQFCNEECRNEHGRVTVACCVCSTEFRRAASLAARSRSYCSPQCQAKYYREQRAVRAKGTCETCGGPTSKKSYRQCVACQKGRPDLAAQRRHGMHRANGDLAWMACVTRSGSTITGAT